jgi:hypothetical protein
MDEEKGKIGVWRRFAGGRSDTAGKERYRAVGYDDLIG